MRDWLPRFGVACLAVASLGIVLGVLAGGDGLAAVAALVIGGVLVVTAAALAWGVGLVRKRRTAPTALAILLAAPMLLLLAPVSDGVGGWKEARARAWCERVTPALRGLSGAERDVWIQADGSPPDLARFDYDGCTYESPGGWSFWRYDLETDSWDKVSFP